ncbi:MAG: hypothetical protein ACUVWO_05890 [Thermodesulfobacteriota bacterium]
MKRILASFALVLILSVLSITAALAQVQTRVRIIEASNVGSNIDPSLRDITGQIRSLFSFSSYRLLRDETFSLPHNQPIIIPVHPGRSLELTLIGEQRGSAEIKVKIKRDRTDILNTQVRLTPGRTVSIGGPKHGEGTLLIALSRL